MRMKACDTVKQRESVAKQWPVNTAEDQMEKSRDLSRRCRENWRLAAESGRTASSAFRGCGADHERSFLQTRQTHQTRQTVQNQTVQMVQTPRTADFPTKSFFRPFRSSHHRFPSSFSLLHPSGL